MPTDYHHGVRVVEVTTGSRVLRTISTAVIGLVAVGEDADVATFPLDTPVLVTDVAAAIGKAGTTAAGNTLLASLNAIAAQCSPLIVVVRVAKGIDDAATASNAIGTTDANGRLTGMQALIGAQGRLGVKPRIIGAPGIDTQAVGVALATVAQKLRGMAYVHADGATSVTEAVAYKANFAQREVMLIWPNFQAWDTGTSATVEVPAVASDTGGSIRMPSAVNGVTGISRDVHWDLQDSANDAGVLNEAGITTLINAQGFKFWGDRTCSDDPLFVFESAVRTTQVLADTIAEGHMWAVDKPMYPSLVKDIIEGINAKFRSLVSGGYLIGGHAWYDETANSGTDLAGGKLVIDYDFTPVPPLENLQLRQRITDQYLADYAAAINA